MNCLYPNTKVLSFSRVWSGAVLLIMLLAALRAFAQSPPVVTTGPGTLLRPGQAIVSGTIDANEQAATYWFEHGLSSSYGNFTPTNTIPAAINGVTVSNLLTSLPRGVSYNFRLVASNGAGMAAGGNMKFTSRAGSNVASSAIGGGQPFDARQPSLELNFIICIAGGVYPSPGGSPSPPFLGEVRLFAGNFAPLGWAFCHGQFLNINENEALFSIVGIDYGGDGQTTFRLPDLRGRTVVGGGPGPESITRIVGERGGANQITLSSTNLPLHNHSLPPPHSAGGSGYTGDNLPYANMQPYLVMSEVFWRAGIFPFPDQNTDEPMLGQISFFAGRYALNNPLPASGQLLPINQNQAVFALIRTNYGGNGQTTFALPNLNGRTAMGIGAGPGPTTWALGEQTGLANAALTAGQLPAHEHAVTGLGIDTGSTGNALPVSLMQPSLAIRYIICNNGFFPPRSFSADAKAAGGVGVSQMMGQINLFAGEFVPGGWLACDGQLLSIANNVGLFSLLGTNFGGNGSNTFALPDLSSRIPVGSSNGICGAAYGAQETVLTTAQMPAHTHTVPTLDFDQWITSHGLSGLEAGFDGDADGDGIKNGVEWATGTIPVDGNSFSRLAISAVGEYALVRFPRNTHATDIRLSLQRAGELSSSNIWTAIASNHFGAWIPPTAPVSISEDGAVNPRNVTVTDQPTNSPSIYRLRID